MKKIVLLFVLVLTLCSCSNNNGDKKIEKINYQEITQKEAEEIVNNELYVLWGVNSLDKVYNQDKLTLAVERFAKDKGYESKHDVKEITKKELEDAFKETSLSNLSLKHENIKGSYMGAWCGHDQWVYDKDKEIYTYQEDGHGACGVFAVFNKPIDFSENNGLYTITYKYAFEVACDMPNGKIYGSYDDASLGNEILTINPDSNYKDVIESKYEEIKNKLATYTFTFQKVDNHITLVDFTR